MKHLIVMISLLKIVAKGEPITKDKAGNPIVERRQKDGETIEVLNELRTLGFTPTGSSVKEDTNGEVRNLSTKIGSGRVHYRSVSKLRYPELFAASVGQFTDGKIHSNVPCAPFKTSVRKRGTTVAEFEEREFNTCSLVVFEGESLESALKNSGREPRAGHDYGTSSMPQQATEQIPEISFANQD